MASRQNLATKGIKPDRDFPGKRSAWQAITIPDYPDISAMVTFRFETADYADWRGSKTKDRNQKHMNVHLDSVFPVAFAFHAMNPYALEG